MPPLWGRRLADSILIGACPGDPMQQVPCHFQSYGACEIRVGMTGCRVRTILGDCQEPFVLFAAYLMCRLRNGCPISIEAEIPLMRRRAPVALIGYTK